MRRGSAGLVCAVLLAACSSHAASPRPSAAVVVREPLVQGERAQSAREERTGHLRVRLLSALAGVPAVTGTHAEFVPLRPLCRVRVRVASADARFHLFVVARQRLVLPGGELLAPSLDATRIKRQPDSYGLGARDVLETDLWFEPPAGVTATALRVYGDTDPDPQGTSVAVAGPSYVDLPVRF